MPFGFSPDWYIKTLGDEKPYRFYLGVGTHTIRMEVVPGDSAAITAELQECVLELNTLYRRILMVTGTQPICSATTPWKRKSRGCGRR